MASRAAGAVDFFGPFKTFINSLSAPTPTNPGTEFDEPISMALSILYDAAETKNENTDAVYNALVELERLQRSKRKVEMEANNDYSTAERMLQNLDGEWRLIFTTGTKETQNKLGGNRINYFPLKAVQSFDTKSVPMKIANGIYVGQYPVLKFFGDFEFDLKKCKLEFDFDQIAVFGLMINLGKGKAAEIGAASGLGSKSNTKLIGKKKPFFNWISADQRIATARGGGGGLALWKKVQSDISTEI